MSIKLGSTGCGKVLISEFQLAQGETMEIPASRTCGGAEVRRRRSIVCNRSIEVAIDFVEYQTWWQSRAMITVAKISS